MKSTLLAVSLVLLSASAVFAAQETAAPAKAAAPEKAAAPAKAAAPTVVVVTAPAAPAAPAKKAEDPSIAFCLARGLCNIATGWLELPRCIVYDNSAIPIFGLIVGIPEGALFTVARELCGVFDIVSFGTSGSLCHGDVFPNFVFQSKWLCKKEK